MNPKHGICSISYASFHAHAGKASVLQKHINRYGFACRIGVPGFIFLPASDIMVSSDSVQRGKR